MAGDDSSKHSDGEELDLTDEQRSAIDQISEILDCLQPGQKASFQEISKGLD